MTPPHTSNIAQEWLASKFGQKFLAKGTWPARSPDLNLMPKTLDDLKINIEREIRNIKQDV